TAVLVMYSRLNSPRNAPERPGCLTCVVNWRVRFATEIAGIEISRFPVKRCPQIKAPGLREPPTVRITLLVVIRVPPRLKSAASCRRDAHRCDKANRRFADENARHES